ncbi:MAG TPA: cytochrome P450 [Acidimicrobiales bacterium]|nr:cytochrome P450 [Acidimicrobiales bacterium]
MTIARTAPLSLARLLQPEVLADPYPLYHELRRRAPVLWDPYLHAFVVTGYDDVTTVLQSYSANRTHAPDKVNALGLGQLAPIAAVMVKQMLFLDPPAHQRTRRLASVAFTPRRVELLRDHIQEITDSIFQRIQGRGEMDVMEDLANPLPSIVTAEMLGVPASDHQQLRAWSRDFAEMLGNFQHNPGRLDRVLRSLEEMTAYFREAVDRQRGGTGAGLVNALATAEVDGDRLSEDEVVANLIVIMVGGQEGTSILIGNGLLTLLRHPEQADRLRADPSLIPAAVEELLRYESPSQHTARLAPDDVELAGVPIQRQQAVIAVMGAANRDPARFDEPDRFDLDRPDNRHLAFGWAAHYCFGASLARLEAQVVFEALLGLEDLRLQPDPLVWRANLGLRGLSALNVAFSP